VIASGMTLHERLVEMQSDEELERKCKKASGRNAKRYWQQEELDLAYRRAKRLSDNLRWE